MKRRMADGLPLARLLRRSYHRGDRVRESGLLLRLDAILPRIALRQGGVQRGRRKAVGTQIMAVRMKGRSDQVQCQQQHQQPCGEGGQAGHAAP